MRTVVFPLVTLIAALVASPPIDPAGHRVRGEWRGTSLCTNRVLAPACKNETVRYVFRGPVPPANTYRLAADKFVDGAWQPMGELDFTYRAADSTWRSPLDAPLCKGCTWWFRIAPPGLVGGLVTGEGDTLRKATARRPPQAARRQP